MASSRVIMLDVNGKRVVIVVDARKEVVYHLF